VHVTTNDDRCDALTPELRFGRQARDRRKALGVSQEAIAQQLRAEGMPLTQTQISRIEEGKRPVRLDEAVALSRALGLDPADTLSAASGASARSADLAERSAWLNVVQNERRLLDQSGQFTQAKLDLQEQHQRTNQSIEAWQLARGAKSRPPARDLSGLEATLWVVRKQLGEGDKPAHWA
jgi:transcriptional regulator with XRE-family HTH domain